jgi:hypothetical protein
MKEAKFFVAALLALAPGVCFAQEGQVKKPASQSGYDYVHFCYSGGVPYSEGSLIQGPGNKVLVCSPPMVIDTANPHPMEWQEQQSNH